MSSISRFLCLILFLLLGSSALLAEKPLRIHLISGSTEYKSEISLQNLQKLLEENYANIEFTASWGKDKGVDLPGISALAHADLVIVFTRRMQLPEDQIAYLRDYISAEKPVIGIRTASHAFENFPIDSEVFGGSYSGHGKDEPVKLEFAPDAAKHPILHQVALWNRPGKLYYNRNLGPKTEVLLYGIGQTSGLREPLAWTNRYGKSGKAFYTSMGLPADFENENFRRLLLNAIAWTADRALQQKT